jgi:cholesterol transport system auxiliary component
MAQAGGCARVRGAAWLVVGAAALLLAGCGGTPKATFDLTAPRDVRVTSGTPRGLLVVPPPTALQVLDTEQIVVSPRPGEVTYADNSQWTDRLPSLLQARIIQAFENGSRLRAVGRPSDRLTPDWSLVTDIRQFGVKVEDGQASAVVELSAKLVTDRGGRIAAAKLFSATAPGATDGAGAAAALDRALAIVLRDMVAWATGRI